MAVFKHKSAGITGIAAAVPSLKYNNFTDNPHFNEEDAKAIVAKTGIFQRRVSDRSTTASDLGFAASQQLFRDMRIDRNEVDMLVFISQTPDYRMPATAITLQHRLGLPKSCAAFDVNLGCSGFVYGLNLAFGFANQSSIRKILLINAETRTKVYSFKDRQTGFLFGDAATACIIERGDQFGESIFALDSDGEKSSYIMIKSGGYRNPSSPESFLEREQGNGSYHNDEQGTMDGAGVFEFVITEVPKHVLKVLELSDFSKDDINFFVFHQANQFMNSHLVKKLKLDEEKVPYCLDRYGNTSSVSIPLTIVSELYERINHSPKTLLISGFGVGLSLGTAIIKMVKPTISNIVEV